MALFRMKANASSSPRPRDADAHLLLGDAYCRLCWSSAERAWDTRLPLLRQLRRQQAITALRRARELKPDSVPAHARLVALYQQSGALDLALTHLQAFDRIQRTQGPHPGESARQFAERVEGAQRDVQQLERDVAARYKAFAGQPAWRHGSTTNGNISWHDGRHGGSAVILPFCLLSWPAAWAWPSHG